MYTSPRRIFLPLLIALGSTGIAGTAIANPETTSPSVLAHPLPTERLSSERPRFETRTHIDFTDPNRGFMAPLAQESTGTDTEQTIVADGSEQRLNLSGQPGRNATEAAVRGRAGLRGGDGRNLTIYYTNPEHLQNIYVDASGGRGGAGAPSSTERVCSTSGSSSNLHNFPSPFPADSPLPRQSFPTPIKSLIRSAPESRPNLPPEIQEHLQDPLYQVRLISLRI